MDLPTFGLPTMATIFGIFKIFFAKVSVLLQVCIQVYTLEVHKRVHEMEIDTQIALRPRFEKIIALPAAEILHKVNISKEKYASDFIIRQLDEHVWIYMSENRKKLHSPHLHIELEAIDANQTRIKGLYGPDPALWTMFIFLHFIVAGIFIIFGVIAYSNWSLKQSYSFQAVIMGLMLVIWFALYFIARSIRKKGMPQTLEIEKVWSEILK